MGQIPTFPENLAGTLGTTGSAKNLVVEFKGLSEIIEIAGNNF
ncbi:hypothetical protein MarSH_066 [Marseillevirus Shanghai 1]|nr:hypothetical protein MarSH_066 [Marseillevirus Shanghai 1]